MTLRICHARPRTQLASERPNWREAARTSVRAHKIVRKSSRVKSLVASHRRRPCWHGWQQGTRLSDASWSILRPLGSQEIFELACKGRLQWIGNETRHTLERQLAVISIDWQVIPEVIEWYVIVSRIFDTCKRSNETLGARAIGVAVLSHLA